MKTYFTLLILACSIFSFTSVIAQNGKNPGANAQYSLSKLDTELNLNKEQEKHVFKILLEYETEIQKLPQTSTQNLTLYKKHLEAKGELIVLRNNKLKVVFNDEQNIKYFGESRKKSVKHLD